MDNILSRKIKILGFISILMVVYLHSYNLTFRYGNEAHVLADPINVFIQNFISEGITRIAVPLFFIISGYLFFFNTKNNIVDFYWFLSKLKKRLKTLLLPYLAWNAISLILFFLMQQIPFTQKFFTHILIEDHSLVQILDALLIHPIPYQLWFIRDLMIYVLLTPLIYKVLSRFGVFPLILLLIFWFFNIPFHIISNYTFFWFGAFVAIKSINLDLNKYTKTKIFILLFWMILLLSKTSLFVLTQDNSIILDHLAILIGLGAVWFNYDILLQPTENKLLALSSFTFFIYAFHEPTLNSKKSY